MTKSTLYVNLFAGPGTGKSTMAAGIFSKLKKLGVNCEYASEWCKDKVWEHSSKVFEDQCYIFGKQHWKLFRLLGEVDVVVTDSPILLSVVYNKRYQNLEPLAVEAFNSMDNLNFFLTRNKTYNPKGRNQDEQGAKEIDDKILDLLKRQGIPFNTVSGDEAGEALVLDVIKRHISLRPVPQFRENLSQWIQDAGAEFIGKPYDIQTLMRFLQALSGRLLLEGLRGEGLDPDYILELQAFSPQIILRFRDTATNAKLGIPAGDTFGIYVC
jgi:nicotinamide riboside kinase